MGAFGSSSAFPTLPPGELRHWITFLEQHITTSLSGKKITWAAGSPPSGAWAKIEAIRGTDLIRAGQDSTVIFLTVSLWYTPDVKANMHILAPSGAEYVINSVENVLELNHILLLNCQAIGPQADSGA